MRGLKKKHSELIENLNFMSMSYAFTFFLLICLYPLHIMWRTTMGGEVPSSS